eukprot:5211644-Amphidinium_carterae.1
MTAVLLCTVHKRKVPCDSVRDPVGEFCIAVLWSCVTVGGTSLLVPHEAAIGRGGWNKAWRQ